MSYAVHADPNTQNQQYHPSTKPLGHFHGRVISTFGSLPEKGKIVEVLKRIGIVAIAIFAYPVLAVLAAAGYCYTKEISNASHIDSSETKPSSTSPNGRIDGSYFVRFIEVRASNPDKDDILAAMQGDQEDYNKGYNKGSCLYTKYSIQPLAVDARGKSTISVKYPFAFLIDRNVELAYWSMQDMDRNGAGNRDKHLEKKGQELEKYQPEDEGEDGLYHNLHACWKTIHFTGVQHFEDKLKAIHPSNQVDGCYLTRNKKKKPLLEGFTEKDLTARSNEGAIRYQPKKDVKGLLVKNTPEAIKLAKEVQKHFKDKFGQRVFIAYQSPDDGKLYRI